MPRSACHLLSFAAVAAIATAAALAKAGPPAAPPAMATVSGPARVIDGDTVVVAGVHVRLKGVDAAELGTPRGEAARRVMVGIAGNSLTCRLTGEHTYSREVGYCATAAGIDIGQAIITSDAALACPRYDDRFVRFEQAEAVVVQPRAACCARRWLSILLCAKHLFRRRQNCGAWAAIFQAASATGSASAGWAIT
jgi:endonuclease YncB( thermonuclease family)